MYVPNTIQLRVTTPREPDTLSRIELHRSLDGSAPPVVVPVPSPSTALVDGFVGDAGGKSIVTGW